MTLRFISPLHKALRQISLHLEERTAQLGLTPGECHMLSFLFSYSPCAIAELIRVFGLKKSTLTSMLNRLTDRGLVVREVNHDDRRSFLIGLTSEGRKLARRVNRPVEEFEEQLASRMSHKDLEGFEAVMSAITDVTAVEVRSSPPQAKTSQPKEKR